MTMKETSVSATKIPQSGHLYHEVIAHENSFQHVGNQGSEPSADAEKRHEYLKVEARAWSLQSVGDLKGEAIDKRYNAWSQRLKK